MKIIVLNGSPRPNGNCAAMIAAFKEGALEKGHEVEVLNVAQMKVNGCLACEYCHTKGEGKCIQQDDMQKLYPMLTTADVLVMASPIYHYNISGQLENVINRTYAVQKLTNLKKTALFLSSGSDNVYEGAIYGYKKVFSDWMKVEDAGIITAYGAQNKSEEKLAECKALGLSL